MNISFYYRKELGQTAVLACSVQNLGKFVVMWKQDGRVISGEFGTPALSYNQEFKNALLKRLMPR